MPPFFSNFLGEALWGISVVLPEAILPGNVNLGSPPSNVWTSVQAYRMNFESEASGSQQGLEWAVPPPYFILSLGDDSDDPNWGAVNRTKRMKIRLFIVGAYADGYTQDLLEVNLNNVRRFFDCYDYESSATYPWAAQRGGGPALFSNFQIQEFGRVDTSESNPWNMQILGGNKGNLIGGHVEWAPGWLVTP